VFGGTNSLDTKLVDHISTLTAKNIIAGLEAATGSNWTPNPQLVLVSIFSNGVPQGLSLSNGPLVATALTNDASTNGLSLDGNIEIDFVPITNDYGTSNAMAFTVGGTVLITNIGGTLIASNTAGTVTPFSGSFPTAITNGSFVYNSTNDTLTVVPFDTNAGIWTILQATLSTNGGNVVTNIIVTTFTNAPSGGPATNINGEVSSKMEVMYGTPKSPSFADVSSFFSVNPNASVFDETGHDIGTTNPAISITNIQTQTAVGITRASLNYFAPTVGSTTNANVTSLSLRGFGTTTLKLDTLAPKKGTNAAAVESIAATTLANVSGTGFAQGTYVTNTNAIGNEIVVSESIGTNTVTGSLSNAVPIVVQGTITIGGLRNLGQ